MTIATVVINNDQAGCAEALSWIADHAARPPDRGRVEGTRSSGIGLARAIQAGDDRGAAAFASWAGASPIPGVTTSYLLGCRLGGWRNKSGNWRSPRR